MSTTQSGTLYGLQWTVGALNAPSAYLGFGGSTATLTETANSVVNLTMAAPATATVTGTITQPSGFVNLPTMSLNQQFGNRSYELWTATTQSAACKIPLLSTSAGKVTLHAMSSSGGRTSEVVFPGLVADTDATFALPVPATLTAPMNSATSVTTSTLFEFTTTPNQIYEVNFDSATARFKVFTTTGSITIPNVPELMLPAGTAYTWTATGFGPHATMDKAADAVALQGVSETDFTTAPARSLTTTPVRNFTSQ
jgi:hypothetical protein